MSSIQGLGVAAQPMAPLYPREGQDNVGLKILSCIPVVGAIANGIIDYQLKCKYESLQKGPQDAPRAVNLLKIANQYNAIRIARNILMVAAVVALFALGFFGILPLVGAAVVFLGTVAVKAYCIHKNRQMIREIPAKGFGGFEEQPIR